MESCWAASESDGRRVEEKEGVGGERQSGSRLASWEDQAGAEICHVNLHGTKPVGAQ